MDNLLQQLQQQIHHEAEHAVEDALNSPHLINRVVGESMRHIGNLLELSSATYLPVRKEEILVPPQKMAPHSNVAAILIARSQAGNNSFAVMITSRTGDSAESSVRIFDIVAYKPDSFDLKKTKFMTLPEEVGQELVRQANILIKGDGHALLHCVLIEDYFKADEATEELFTSDLAPTPAPTQAPAAPAVAGNGLPEVDHGLI